MEGVVDMVDNENSKNSNVLKTVNKNWPIIAQSINVQKGWEISQIEDNFVETWAFI